MNPTFSRRLWALEDDTVLAIVLVEFCIQFYNSIQMDLS